MELRKDGAMQGNLLSTQECADRKGVSRQAILNAINRKTLPAQKMGRDWFIKEEDCNSYTPAHSFADRGRRNANRPKQKRETGDAPKE